MGSTLRFLQPPRLIIQGGPFSEGNLFFQGYPHLNNKVGGITQGSTVLCRPWLYLTLSVHHTNTHLTPLKQHVIFDAQGMALFPIPSLACMALPSEQPRDEKNTGPTFQPKKPARAASGFPSRTSKCFSKPLAAGHSSKSGFYLGVDSSSILFSHPSFQKPAISPGFLALSRKKDPWKEWGSYPYIFAEMAWMHPWDPCGIAQLAEFHDPKPAELGLSRNREPTITRMAVEP